MRKSGLLLHITSLPSKYGIGDLGPEAYRFADFLAEAKQKCWQVLPVNPPDIRTNPPLRSMPYGTTYSPYDCLSAFAGNSLLISPELLERQGLLTKREIQNCPPFADTKVEFHKVLSYKEKLFNSAYESFKKTRKSGDYERFCAENRSWLDDFAAFVALRERFWPKLWCDWPVELRERWERPLKSAGMKLHEPIERQMFLQYVFFKQWFDLKRYCNQSGIEIIGDIPIYVSYSSADVWSRPEIFKLNRYRRPLLVSGVPPDYFSKTGQLWGNPVYHWLYLKKTNYAWWLERIRHNLTLFDRVRLDHFRGFFNYWQVPARSKTAKNGKWAKGPGKEFFDVVFKHFPKQSLIAEDLGRITPDVREFVEESNLTCMRVIQFAFGGNPATNLHWPHNHVRNSVCYTGTHDNNTAVGWFKDASRAQINQLIDYLGHKPKVNDINWDFIRLALASVADLAIIPVQDILGLDAETRMNRPADSKGNWVWRLRPGMLTSGTSQIAKELAKMTETFGR